MRHWNYRVIKSFDKVTCQEVFSIHEVYYDDGVELKWEPL